MKILVISNLYPPDFLGGYELGCRQVVDALRAADHDVRVLTSVPRTPVPSDPAVDRRLRLSDIYDAYSQSRGSRVVHAIRHLEAQGLQAFNVHVLSETLTGFDPDVVYFWNLVGVGGLGLMACTQVLGYPWVMHIMDAVPNVLCSLPFQVRRDTGEAFARMFDGRYLCCSRTVLDEILAAGIPIADRATLIPNWVDTVGSPDRTEYAPGGHLRVVSAGSLSRNKGTDIVIRAAKLLSDRGHRNFGVDIYGVGDPTEFERLVRELDVGESVRLGGVRSQAELARMYRDYDVFVFPTHAREPFGFAPMEASAHGCVPIVSGVCGYSEWMVDGVDCIKAERSPTAFADALERLSADPELLRAIGRSGMQAVLHHYRLPAILPQIEMELARAAARPRTRSGTTIDAHRMAIVAEKTFQIMLQEAYAA